MRLHNFIVEKSRADMIFKNPIRLQLINQQQETKTKMSQYCYTDIKGDQYYILLHFNCLTLLNKIRLEEDKCKTDWWKGDFKNRRIRLIESRAVMEMHITANVA
jgi:hypothetical protein